MSYRSPWPALALLPVALALPLLTGCDDFEDAFEDVELELVIADDCDDCGRHGSYYVEETIVEETYYEDTYYEDVYYGDPYYGDAYYDDALWLDLGLLFDGLFGYDDDLYYYEDTYLYEDDYYYEDGYYCEGPYYDEGY